MKVQLKDTTTNKRSQGPEHTHIETKVVTHSHVQNFSAVWREHFFNLLNGRENETPRDGEPETAIDDGGKDVPLPVYSEVRIELLSI